MNGEKKDDPEISDDDGLLRRLPNWPNMVKFDHNMQVERPSSAWFTDRSTSDREVSITLEKDLIDSGGTHQDAVSSYPDFGLAVISTKTVRHEISPKQIVNKQPTDDDDFHGLVIGEKRKKTKTALAKKANILINPVFK